MGPQPAGGVRLLAIRALQLQNGNALCGMALSRRESNAGLGGVRMPNGE